MSRFSNWAGNYVYRARRLHRPTSIEELRAIVSSAPRIRVLGSRHSFSAIADSDELVTLDGLPLNLTVDRSAMTISLSAAMRYGELAVELNRQGLALPNLASLPHISVAGAIATATHGSGERNGNLATSVSSLELVSSTGERLRFARGDPEFEGVVVGLGAVGAVTRITLDVEPAYEVGQRVFERMAWPALIEHFDEIMAAGYSVSAFSRWGENVEQVWVKSRVGGHSEQARPELFGAAAAKVHRHPIVGLDPVHATPQLGQPGAWSDRLPHFRMGFTPSAGNELQSEYLLPRGQAAAAIEALLERADTLQPLTQVSEIRTVAADRLWMSPAYEQDLVAVHFTWAPDPDRVSRALGDVEAALLPLGARPHWGKLFNARADVLAPRYPRLQDFRALLERLDPRGAFRNEWLGERLLGP